MYVRNHPPLSIVHVISPPKFLYEVGYFSAMCNLGMLFKQVSLDSFINVVEQFTTTIDATGEFVGLSQRMHERGAQICLFVRHGGGSCAPWAQTEYG
jgi:hypothetical protein